MGLRLRARAEPAHTSSRAGAGRSRPWPATRSPSAVVTTQTPAWIADAVGHRRTRAVQLSAGADGPSVADVRAAAAEPGAEPLRDRRRGHRRTSSSPTSSCSTPRTPGSYGGTGRAARLGARWRPTRTPRERPRPRRRPHAGQRRRRRSPALRPPSSTSPAAWSRSPASRTPRDCVTSSPPWNRRTSKPRPTTRQRKGAPSDHRDAVRPLRRPLRAGDAHPGARRADGGLRGGGAATRPSRPSSPTC